MPNPQSKYLRLTIYSYLSGTELFHKITHLSKYERQLVKSSKLFDFRGNFNIQYFSKQKFPLVIFLFANKLSFKICNGAEKTLKIMLEIFKRMPLKFVQNGVDLEVVDQPDSQLISAIAERNIRFNKLVVKDFKNEIVLTDDLRQFMMSTKELELNNVRFKFGCLKEVPATWKHCIEIVKITKSTVTGADEFMNEPLRSVNIDSSNVDNGIFDKVGPKVTQLTLNNIDIAHQGYRYTRFIRMLQKQKCIDELNMEDSDMNQDSISEICESVKTNTKVFNLRLTNKIYHMNKILFKLDFIHNYKNLVLTICYFKFQGVKLFPQEQDYNFLSRTYLDRELFREYQKFFFKIYQEGDEMIFIRRNKTTFKIRTLQNSVLGYE